MEIKASILLPNKLDDGAKERASNFWISSRRCHTLHRRIHQELGRGQGHRNQSAEGKEDGKKVSLVHSSAPTETRLIYYSLTFLFLFFVSNRSRDSALSAVTATSRENYQKWLPHLLHEVSLPDANLPSFFSLLTRLSHSGSLVKTLRIERESQEGDPKADYKPLKQLWVSFSKSLERTLDQEEFVSELLKEFFDRCINLQILFLVGGLPLVDKNGFPFRFLAHSLKSLFVGNSTAESRYQLTGMFFVLLSEEMSIALED